MAKWVRFWEEPPEGNPMKFSNQLTDAQAAQVSRQSINSIERNRYVPSLELALTFARVFACPTDHIFQLENEK